MKNIITAIGNERLNNELKKYDNIKIETTDIQYQEGIIESLDKYENVDMVILKEDIIGDLELEDLINSITIIKNDIEIILIKKYESSERFFNKNIVKIIIESENYIEKVVQYLTGKELKTIEQEKKQNIEIQKCQNIKIPTKKFIKKKNFSKKNVIQKIVNSIKTRRKKEAEIITFIGASGTGKTTLISIIAKMIKKKKVLIIDFDLINNNLYLLFGVLKYPKEMQKKLKDNEYISEFVLNEKNLIKLRVKINNKIDLIASPNVIFDEEYKYENEKLQKIIAELKNKYDVILIDTSSDTKYNQLRKILINITDKVICITEGNILQIGKSVRILKEIQEKKKVKIIYNKKNKYTISKKMLEIVLLKYKVIGSVEYNDKFNKIINKNIRNIDYKIKKDVEKIIKKIM